MRWVGGRIGALRRRRLLRVDALRWLLVGALLWVALWCRWLLVALWCRLLCLRRRLPSSTRCRRASPSPLVRRRISLGLWLLWVAH